MKFRDDIDPLKTYVVSDTHFGHNNIIGFCHRPPDHEQIMMERWARAVPEDATVLHLGDLVYRSNAMFKNVISKHLTGSRKLLIMGNHDRQRYSFYKASGFNIVKPFALQIGWYEDGVPFLITDDHAEGNLPTDYSEAIVSFSHYPWSDEEEGHPMPANYLRIHGHIHNNGYARDAFVPFLKNHINVSVEQTKYRPVLLANLLSGYLNGTVAVTADDVQNGIEEA